LPWTNGSDTNHKVEDNPAVFILKRYLAVNVPPEGTDGS
jgi:hypothetical protein